MGDDVALTDAAHQLHRSYAATWRLVLTGELPGHRRGRHWMVTKADLQAFLARERVM